jgi:two-component system CheB/CheR fusion protein
MSTKNVKNHREPDETSSKPVETDSSKLAEKPQTALAKTESITQEESVVSKQIAPATLDEHTSPEKIEPIQKENTFPIVGIGASAGGLAAFENFFTHMSVDSGMGFVLVQHLDPTHKSILVDLVQKYTAMQVIQIEDRKIRIEPNCVYVTPSNKDLAIFHGNLHPMEPVKPHGSRLPIDFFFRSLAEDQRDRAICVIVSGTGTDGTLGMRSIKGEEGLVMVQDPETASYDGMPKSAINTELVDYILPLDKMPAQLIEYTQRTCKNSPLKIEKTESSPADELHKIFILLRNKTGHDFSHYKQNTIERRIDRRMAVNKIDRRLDYIRYLQRNGLEIEKLFREFLIGVTSFFRDQEAFDSLKNKVIPNIFENRHNNNPVRIWISGCATGEEAYSIAILVKEYMNLLQQDVKIQIFATDIDNDAIEKARLGIYPEGIAIDVPQEYLNRFFIKGDNSYQVSKQIREMIVFAAQSLVKDPPFSKLDLISCRNLLIYLGSSLQKKVFPIFHYALNQKGFLFLGSSETIGEFDVLFSTIDRKWKLFQHQVNLSTRKFLDFSPPLMIDGVIKSNDRISEKNKKRSLAEMVEKILLKEYTPAAILINEKGDILYFHGRTGKYLEPASGEAQLNALNMARPGLKLELTTAVRKVINQKKEVVYNQVPVQTNGNVQVINLIIKPFLEPDAAQFGQQNLMMIIFENVASPKIDDDLALDLPEESTRIIALEQELRSTKESLQTTIEELETSNEELKSTNEEMQSSNEELQSTNEELETSKEELQSVNEELVTVNTEHQNKIYELSRANNDLSNLLSSTDIATIFLDDKLHIKRFTPSATQVINLIQTDIGRPINHIVSNLTYENLAEDVQKVLKTLIFKEQEVSTKDGLWYLMRIIPYRTVENVIDGAVVTFINVTKQKNGQEALRKGEAKYRSLVQNSPDLIVIVDREGIIQFINRELAKLNVEDMIGKSVYDYIITEHHDQHRKLIAQVFQTGQTSRIETRGIYSHETVSWYEHRIAPIKDDHQIDYVMLIASDITKYKQIEEKLLQAHSELEQLKKK